MNEDERGQLLAHLSTARDEELTSYSQAIARLELDRLGLDQTSRRKSFWDRCRRKLTHFVACRAYDCVVRPARIGRWSIPFATAPTPQRRVIEHGGRVPGFSASFSLMPDEQLTVIVLTNNVASDPMRLARGLSAVALGDPYVSPLVREPAPIAAKLLQRYEGDYELDGVVWKMRVHRGRLFSRPNEYPDEIEILPDSDTTFFLLDSDVSLRAQLDDEGRVVGLVVTPGGQVAKKLP